MWYLLQVGWLRQLISSKYLWVNSSIVFDPLIISHYKAIVCQLLKFILILFSLYLLLLFPKIVIKKLFGEVAKLKVKGAGRESEVGSRIT